MGRPARLYQRTVIDEKRCCADAPNSRYDYLTTTGRSCAVLSSSCSKTPSSSPPCHWTSRRRHLSYLARPPGFRPSWPDPSLDPRPEPFRPADQPRANSRRLRDLPGPVAHYLPARSQQVCPLGWPPVHPLEHSNPLLASPL